jgi:hypothetical protein
MRHTWRKHQLSVEEEQRGKKGSTCQGDLDKGAPVRITPAKSAPAKINPTRSATKRSPPKPVKAAKPTAKGNK